MSAPSLLEIAVAVAAVVSAVGGCAGAYAALLSARSAREATAAAEAASRQAALREVSRTATSIVAESNTHSSACIATEGALKAAMAFSGTSGHSGYEDLISKTRDVARAAEPLVADAKLFTGGALSLSDAPMTEIERVGHRLWENLEKLRVLHRQNASIHERIERQNDEHRSEVIGKMHR